MDWLKNLSKVIDYTEENPKFTYSIINNPSKNEDLSLDDIEINQKKK